MFYVATSFLLGKVKGEKRRNFKFLCRKNCINKGKREDGGESELVREKETDLVFALHVALHVIDFHFQFQLQFCKKASHTKSMKTASIASIVSISKGTT